MITNPARRLRSPDKGGDFRADTIRLRNKKQITRAIVLYLGIDFWYLMPGGLSTKALAASRSMVSGNSEKHSKGTQAT